MIVKNLFLYSVFALLVSCSNNADTTAETFDSTLLEMPEEDASVSSQFQTSFASLYTYLKTRDSSFSPEQYEFAGKNVLDTSINNPLNKQQVEAFYPCLIFNSDSSLAIDLYSYNYTLKPATGKLEESGPDTEVGLIDFKANSRRRIYFSGPAAAIVDAAWQQDGKILLAGAEMIELERIKPFNLSIDLDSRQVEVSNYRQTINANFINYRNSKCGLLE